MVESTIVDSSGATVIDLSECASFCYSEFNGVHSVLRPELKENLDSLIAALEDFRTHRKEKIMDSGQYVNLPYIPENQHIWKNRQRDLEFLISRYSFENKRILEIGSWNGWLTHRLANAGASVTAIGYFTDRYDGLGARIHYPNANWTSVQMDCEDLSILKGNFDIIIFNWNLMNFNHPFKIIEDAKSMLSKNGLLIGLGLLVYKNTKRVKRQFQSLDEEFQDTYKRSIYLRPSKGYFSEGELHRFERIGFKVTSVTGKMGVLKSHFKLFSAVPYRAIYQNRDE